MDKIRQQNEHFGKISEEYYSARQNSNHLYYKKLLFDYVLESLNTYEGKKIKVLEPMCGYGEGKKILERKLKKRIDYEGFDYSDALIEKVNNLQHGVGVYKQDVTSFEPDEEKYDIVILLGGIHHVPDYAQSVCCKFYKALKPGGLFINFEPTNNNWLVDKIRKIIYNKNHIFDADTERAFTLNELNCIYQNCGFRILQQFYPGLLAYIMYYNPDAFPILNVGGAKCVKNFFKIDSKFYKSRIGRKISFCTFSILQK